MGVVVVVIDIVGGNDSPSSGVGQMSPDIVSQPASSVQSHSATLISPVNENFVF